MSEQAAVRFAQRIVEDRPFREGLVSLWGGAELPTLMDLSEMAARYGYHFTSDEMALMYNASPAIPMAYHKLAAEHRSRMAVRTVH